MHRLRALIPLLLIALGMPAAYAWALPDAELVAITVRGSGWTAGQRVPVSVEIRNRGDAPLPPVTVALTVDETRYADQRLPAPLGPGESTTWNLTYTGIRGMHLLVATVDPLNDVVEADQSNNSAFINLGIAEPGSSISPLAWVIGAVSFLIGLGAGVWLRRPHTSPRRRPTARPSQGPPPAPPSR